jgi:deoxycytidylate deaminase
MARKKYTTTAKCYTKKGMLLSVGENSYQKTNPLMAFHSKLVGEPEKQFLHAECAALLRCKDKKPHTIVVERYSPTTGRMLLAKPCIVCESMIKSYGIKRVVYTTEDGLKEEWYE